MSITLNAIYENGVLKPLENISLKEHEKVKIDINLDDKLKKRLHELTEAVYKRTDKYSSKEIEDNISQAYKEVRDLKCGHILGNQRKDGGKKMEANNKKRIRTVPIFPTPFFLHFSYTT